VDAKEDVHWKAALGSQIREHRRKAHLTQEKLAGAVGLTRNMIIEYEAGRAAPDVQILGSIALRIGMGEFKFNGHRFSVRPSEPQVAEPVEQLNLNLGQEYVYPQATVSITPTKLMITITAVAPAPPLSATGERESKRQAS
jgi:transcriptional regulator with XRE-family HTH domain